MDGEEVLRSVFKIRSSSGSGTCFLYGDKNHVLTAKHVVVTQTGDPAGDIVVEAEPGGPHKAIARQLLQSCDVALIGFDHELPGTPLEPVAPEAYEPAAETAIRAPGFPEWVNEKWQPGKLVNRVRTGEYELRFEHLLAAQLSGLSGAPALDLGNRVLGVITEHDPATPSAGKMAPLADFRSDLDFSGPTPRFSCLAIFSDNEPSENGILRPAVNDAIGILGGEWKLTQCSATDCVASVESYKKMVHDLCRADVCIFDLTEYEEAAMLLLGIRSVVKRSIPIGSTSGSIQDAPYDIKELSLLSHAEAESEGISLTDAIIKRIKAGRDAQDLQHYLDLPTFDAVRNLPPGRRKDVPRKDRVLILSSYKTEADRNFTYIKKRLKVELQKRKIEVPKIFRVIDLNVDSPWLVSQNMYEAIRRTELCIVDWTGFPANVFFELGVRISVRDSVTLSILENEGAKALSRQRENLVTLFDPARYQLTDAGGEAISKIMKLSDDVPKHAGGPSAYTFAQITEAIDARQGLTARSVLDDLLQSAELLGADDTEALSGVLYPKNRELNTAAQGALKERLWAAWYYMKATSSDVEIANDPKLTNTLNTIASGLLAVLGDSDPQITPIFDTKKKMLELAKKQKLELAKDA